MTATYGQHSEYALPRSTTLGPRTTLSLAVDMQTAISGKTEAVLLWEYPKRQLDVEYGPRVPLSLDEIITAYIAHDATAVGFRARDRSDYTSSGTNTVAATDQVLIADVATHSGLTVDLYKTRSIGAITKTRRIRKPLPRGFVVAVDGVETTNFEVDCARGTVTFPSEPNVLWPDADEITWGGYFDVPVRFAEALTVESVSFEIESAPSVLLTEMFDDDDLNPATEADEYQAALGPSEAELALSVTEMNAYIAAVASWPS